MFELPKPIRAMQMYIIAFSWKTNNPTIAANIHNTLMPKKVRGSHLLKDEGSEKATRRAEDEVKAGGKAGIGQRHAQTLHQDFGRCGNSYLHQCPHGT